MSGLGLVLEMWDWVVCDMDWCGISGLWSCPKCNTWWFSLLKVPRLNLLFKNFCWPFYIHFGIKLALKNWGGVFMIGWKKDLYNCKFNFTFQQDGCTEPTFTAMCFIHSGVNRRPDNIQLIFTFFNWNIRSLIVFIFVCLFIHFAGELIQNVFVNQKRFLYMTGEKRIGSY